jgi:hypothetical protein
MNRACTTAGRAKSISNGRILAAQAVLKLLFSLLHDGKLVLVAIILAAWSPARRKCQAP